MLRWLIKAFGALALNESLALTLNYFIVIFQFLKVVYKLYIFRIC